MDMRKAESEAVRFFHIPKTAGTSVNGVLSSVYRNGETFDFSGDIRSDLERLRSLRPQHRASLRLFRGHAPLRTGENDVDNAKTFALFREPVSRVISFCRHVAEGKSEYLLSDFPPEKFDLDVFLGSGCDELSNFQTRMLLGNGDYADQADLPGDEDLFSKRVDEQLSRLSFAGTDEHYRETMVLVSRLFGWRIVLSTKALNRSRRSTELSFTPARVERIRELNRLDERLYHRVAARLQPILLRNRVKIALALLRMKVVRAARLADWRIRTALGVDNAGK
jgi:hypothetical protein